VRTGKQKYTAVVNRVLFKLLQLISKLMLAVPFKERFSEEKCNENRQREV
jgi:hypothetical protein